MDGRRSDFALTYEEKMSARTALQLLDGSGITLEEAARRALVGRRGMKKCLMPAALDLFLRSRLDHGVRPATLQWYEEKLNRFAERWAERSVDTISRAELRAAIEEEQVTAATKAGLARALRALWRFCAAQEPALTLIDATHGLRTSSPRRGQNPSAGREAFLSVADCTKLLNGLPQYRDALALMLFAGVRPAEISGKHKPKLVYRCVNREEQFIRIPGEVAKTGRPRLIQRLPPTLWHWFSHPVPGAATRADQPVTSVLALQIRRVANALMRRELPHDCFRHTFATYGVALQGEADTVSMWLGHEGRASLIFNTYMGLATHGEAVKFWALRPEK